MHGGDIYRNLVNIDFSVNVNPLGIPDAVKVAMHKSIDNANCYPDIYCEELRREIAKKHGLSKDTIICGNGASELIMALCQSYAPKKAMLLAPGFSGYKKALDAVGTDILYYYLNEKYSFIPTMELVEEIRNKRPQLVFFTNPSNPSGVLMPREYVLDVANACKSVGAYLVVDECFIELTGKSDLFSVVNYLKDYDNMCVLRAFTKSFSIPGIRLGYLLCSKKRMAEQIGKLLPEWNVSIVAQAAGIEAIKHEAFLLKSGIIIDKERVYLKEELGKLGLKVYPSYANYLMFYFDKFDIAKKLLAKKILIRDCSDYEGLEKGYYRVAVKLRKENDLLISEIKKLI